MIIGLCGLAGSGKNAVAEILERRYGVEPLSFAEPLYRAISIFTGLSVKELQRRDVKERPIEWLGRSPRQMLQTLGTEWGRGCVNEQMWVRIALRAAEGRSVAISDVRFANEAQAVLDAGGAVWLVRRPQAGLAGPTGQHTSEAGVPATLISRVLDNSGSLDDLEAAVDAAWHSLQEDRMEVSLQ